MAIHDTKHEIRIDAEPDVVFGLIQDVSGWPHVFGPTVHVDLLLDEGDSQLLRIWATAQGGVHDWTSRRTLDPGARRVSFQQIVSKPPVASMSGEWIVAAAGPGACHVVLTHRFAAIADDPAAVTWIDEAIDRNSTVELGALKRAAELGAGRGELHFSFTDAEMIEGSAAAVFEFVRRADLWPQRLPHVARVELEEEPGGVQRLTMDTSAPDGSVHTTTSVRLCFPDRRVIVYKQLRLAPVMAGHTGRWQFEQDGGTVFARSWHTVTLDPDGVRAALGPDATPAEARARVRHALGTNSLATLRRAKEFVEGGGG
ncbi:SRPBCC family protein [Catenulispora yoronensis]|uniref:SRPBCC family protein n=1 Tax=Catenulispora yoronensis TaxID=450799 RepID=A0ABP5GRH0_9ACTN